jgi:hypothetical protein
MYHGRRIRRLMIWLSKHLVIMFKKEIFKNRNLCLVKPRVMFWRTQFKPPLQAGQTGRPGQTASSGRLNRPSGGNPASATISSKTAEDEVGDWRTPLVKYLQDPKSMIDKKVRRWALKFVLDGDELYRRTTNDLLLKCLGPD